ncbi:LRR receptor-like serine/threonine-protein kinase EFR [Vitis vinifera]|uniref:LRR receptor-like serine/threonine-protein kinase EFR n=1 Tax=Vitis vinifera TaxID=29760 RepID=A0A438CCW8_VITVI|nr:LRR receptor-like serine/threonine-protein kinase EFR [Vitis vinifera]
MGKNSGLFPHTSVFLMHCWVAFLSPTASLANLADELSLLAMKAHITSDSKDVLATNWSTTTSYCNWFGVSCDAARQRVIALDLSNMDLEGPLHPKLATSPSLLPLILAITAFMPLFPMR